MKFIIFISILFCSINVKGQNQLSLFKARDLSILHSPKTKTANAWNAKGQAALKSAFTLNNPVVKYESPSGEFMTIGVDQSFSFPTVYGNKKKLVKAQANLMEIESYQMKADVIYTASLMYLNAQYSSHKSSLLNARLKVLENLVLSNEQMYKAGEIDFLTLSNAKSELIMAQMSSNRIVNELKYSKEQLAAFLKIEDGILVDSLSPFYELSSAISSNGTTLLDQQISLQNDIAQKEIILIKSQNLPDIFVGYQNQGIKETPYKYRFNIGMSIPIWLWQNKASVSTAKANAEYVSAQSENLKFEQKMRLIAIQNQTQSLHTTIDYFINYGLKNNKEMESASQRMYSAGEIPLVHHLENMLKSFDMNLQHIEDIKNYNMLILELEYLNTK